MMGGKTKIEWTESTWNPVTGCTKVSDGCKNCYAYALANRLKLMKNPKYENGFNLTLHDSCLHDPFKWKKPTRVFVNSMSDLFHEDIPTSFIQKVFEVMNQASWHTFQVLTKRAERLLELSKIVNWTPNIWQGVTVESDKYKHRIDILRQVEAKVRFISFEPLIARVNNPDLSGIDWAIVGGESGTGARKMDPEWAISLKDECQRQNVMFYFKQWGGTNKKKNGRILLGQTWDAMPEIGAK